MIIFFLLAFISNAQKRMNIQISPSFSFGNSVIVQENTSFINFQEETHLFNNYINYGINSNIFFTNRYSYYQSRLNGLKIGILRSVSNQSISYNKKTLKNKYSFIDIPILFTQSSTNHQVFVFEVGPMFTYSTDDRKSYFSGVFKMGISNHISKKISYNILFSNNYTKLSKPKKFKLNNGIEFNLLYRINK